MSPESVTSLAKTEEATSSVPVIASEDGGAQRPKRGVRSAALLDEVNEILNNECGVDNSQLVSILRGIGAHSENLAEEANAVAEGAMTAQAPIHGNTVRKDLVQHLMRLLHGSGSEAIVRLHRKVKTFVFNMHTDWRKKLFGSGDVNPLTLEQQEYLLKQYANVCVNKRELGLTT